MKKIFVCFPLTHQDPEVVSERIKRAKIYCLSLFKEGMIPFTPALTGLTILDHADDKDISFLTWEHFCYAYMEPCDEVHVLMLPGWDGSTGVAAELKKAELHDKKVIYIKL